MNVVIIIVGVVILSLIVGVYVYKTQQDEKALQEKKMQELLLQQQKQTEVKVQQTQPYVQQINTPNPASIPLNTSTDMVVSGNAVQLQPPPTTTITPIVLPQVINTSPVSLVPAVTGALVQTAITASQPTTTTTSTKTKSDPFLISPTSTTTKPVVPTIKYVNTTVHATNNVLSAQKGPNTKTIQCPSKTKLSIIKLKSGDAVDSIGIVCSDGTIIENVGGTKGNLQILTGPNSGISKFTVKSGDRIDSLDFPEVTSSSGKTKNGGDGGSYSSDVICPNQGYLTGFELNYGDQINSIKGICTHETQ